jgi:hypothetical protein
MSSLNSCLQRLKRQPEKNKKKNTKKIEKCFKAGDNTAAPKKKILQKYKNFFSD